MTILLSDFAKADWHQISGLWWLISISQLWTRSTRAS